MESYKEKWSESLMAIREKYGQKYYHWFDVWFGGLRVENYNPATHNVLLNVPSSYVMEFMETNGMKDLRQALLNTFGSSIKLSYRVEPSFADIADYVQRQGQGNKHDIRQIHIANARERMEEGLKYYLKDRPVQWLRGYDKVVEWLTDNKGRGLLCVGTPGLGKTLVCQKVLPILIGGGNPVTCVNASQLHDRLEELKREKILVIDDLGKEPRKHYGDIDQSFYELCDNAERTGAILIITTNLATTPDSDPRYTDDIQHRYGDEVLSRLKAITRVARFYGEDLRK